MKNYTYQINEIIKTTSIKKWQLASELNVAPSYLSLKLRDGIKTDKELKRYYSALVVLLDRKQSEIEKSKKVISDARAELDKEMA